MVPLVTARDPGPEAAQQPQTITLPPPHMTDGLMKYCVSFTPDRTGKLTFVS